ncbi:MAG: gas vesicle protein GvpD [Nanoarchaeota archaeon]|nr:gas vesicle protein GvpD [Nanoarchaeota archaeon]
MKEVKRVSSGIPGFDKLVQGGFKEKSINLVIGGPGSGKTIFAMMFLVEGLKKGEPGIYVTFEEKKEKMYEDMKSFGWDIEKYEKEGLFSYLEYTPEQVKKVLIEGGGTIDSVVTKMKAKRMVIDSVTSFALLYREELAKKEAALALFEMIDRWGCTAVMTSQDTSLRGIEVSSALEFEVDSIVILYHEKRKGVRIRGLEILKMRGTKVPNETYALKIDKNGLAVLPEKMKF